MDRVDDRLRRAMGAGAARFDPSGPLGATRSKIVARVRRRQRQVVSLAVAAVLVMSGTAVAWAVGGAGGASSRQVAAGGTTRSSAAGSDSGTATGIAGTSGVGGADGSGGAQSSTGDAAGRGKPSSPSTAAGVGGSGPQATTVAPPNSPATTPSTAAPALPPATTIPHVAAVVTGTVLFGPVCPVERIPPDPACAARPGPARIQLLRADGTVAAQGNAGSDGRFTIPVAPGSYTVEAQAVTATPGVGRGCSATPTQVTVTAGGPDTVAVSCDTGIR